MKEAKTIEDEQKPECERCGASIEEKTGSLKLCDACYVESCDSCCSDD
ncbi:hypothetical protein [Pelagicoccus albus]|uniref:Uncharacterized protein n=1 Tax=Pelagicoccus albus TaxID=415222 RepID=A0A7X1B4I9_9BACT|nr:hypothetical protein [Pelagicoccus albus]MBC2605534.1 hypothetical protein [Pelagicoccus albus]